MRSLALAAIILLSSCSTVPVPVALEAPPELVLPALSEADVACLTDDAYDRLVTRDKLLQARIQTLLDIINSTHDH